LTEAASCSEASHEGILPKKKDSGELICEKCVEKERQINEVLAELKSAHLIIDLLRGDLKQHLAFEHINNCVSNEALSEAYQESNWKHVTPKLSNSNGNNEKHILPPSTQTFESKNQYSPLVDLDQEISSSSTTLAELKKGEASKLHRKQHSDLKRTWYHKAKTHKQHSDLKRTWYHKANTHKQHADITNQDTIKHNQHEQLGRQKMPRHQEGNQVYYIPTIINGILSLDSNGDSTSEASDKAATVHSNRTVVHKEYKIVLIGDSHTRGWAMRLKNNIQ
jgi:hypothetical protein